MKSDSHNRMENRRVNRREFVSDLGVAAAALGLAESGLGAARVGGASDYVVAAYYFGNYHADRRNEAVHGKGWTEWRLVEGARARFPGHAQPKVPLWGFEDESKPGVFERKIRAAANGGLSAFIFDWYWYNDGPFLQGALEEGYLRAANRNDLKFALMWANHDWFDIHPAKLGSPPHLQFPGEVTPETFERLTDHVVRNYFSQSSYLSLAGCPYFSIYELYRFVKGMGGVKEAAAGLRRFRAKTVAAGFRDLHLNAITWGVQLLPGQTDAPDLKGLLDALGVDSTTSYVWIHHVKLEKFPVTQYQAVAEKYERYRAGAAAELGKPYFPNVSMGWDSSPRACQSDIYTPGEYPFMAVIEGNTPARFGEALRSAKRFVDAEPGLKSRLVTINSWNEWTEGSYLEPDTKNRYGYLEEIAKVFGRK